MISNYLKPIQGGLRKENTNNISFVSFLLKREKKTFFPPFSVVTEKGRGVRGGAPKELLAIIIRGFAVAPEPLRAVKRNRSEF